MKTIIKTKLYSAIYMLLFLLAMSWGCDPFNHDGITTPDLISQKGYFYILDRGQDMLVMLDAGMHELKRWSLRTIAPDTLALQGITFAGKNVWVALSGNEKFIAQLDATADTLAVLQKIPVPPVVGGATQGTVRGVAYDGQYMWAVNSGSPTNTLPSTLFKINMTTDSVIASYPMPAAAPRGITYANIPLDAYGKGPSTGLYYLDNTTKMIYYFNNKVPFFDTLCAAPVPPAGTTYDQTLGITNDGTFFYTLSYSDIAAYLFKVSYLGTTQFSYKLPYQYPVAVVWANYDIRYIAPPSISTISPATGAVKTSESVTITGADFRKGTGLSLSLGQGIIVDTLNYLSPTSLYAHLVIDSAAVLGKRNVVVTNPDGRTGSGDSLFTVTAAPVTEYLFLIDNVYDSLFQIRIQDSVIVHSWGTKSVSASHPHGLAYDGANLWMAFNGTDYRIYKIDMTGATLAGSNSFSCPAAVGTVQGLTYDNGYLWLLQTPPAAPSRGLIYKLDPVTGAVTDTITAPGVLGGRGLCFANGWLYCNDRDSAKIYRCNPTAKQWSLAFLSPPPPAGTTAATGMHWNGSTFWIANSGGTNSASDVLINVSLGGNILRYVTAPYPGPAKPQGIVYIAN